jgi:uncharacterized membrane protein
MSDPVYVFFMLCAVAATAEWLAQRGPGRKLGGAMIALGLAALLANLGVIPTASNAPPLYGQVVAIGAPVSIFLMLLGVHLAALRRAGGVMLAAFALAAAGTMVGVTVAFWLTDASEWLGRFAAPLGGMYVATYIGGGANFNALALHYGVVDEAALFAGANAVDNVATTLWIGALLVLPGLVHGLLRSRPAAAGAATLDPPGSSPAVTLGSLATLLALTLGAHWISGVISEASAARGAAIPAVLILTTLALLAAQLRPVQSLGGADLLGTYGAYMFLAVIGAYCDLAALAELGRIGGLLALFVGLAVLIHGAVAFGGGVLLRIEPEVMAVASSANIGGATTAMPIARSLGRMDLLLPGILAGSLGNAVGTYAGFLAAWWLGG